MLYGTNSEGPLLPRNTSPGQEPGDDVHAQLIRHALRFDETPAVAAARHHVVRCAMCRSRLSRVVRALNEEGALKAQFLPNQE
jgi:hypothetical protein